MSLGIIGRTVWRLVRLIPPSLRPTCSLIWQLRWADERQVDPPVRQLLDPRVLWDIWRLYEERAAYALSERSSGRAHVIRALARIPTAELLDRCTHSGAARFLAFIGRDPDAQPELLRWLGSEQVPATLRMEAARGVTSPEAAPTLLRLLGRPDYPTAELFALLAKLGDARGLPLVRSRLGELAALGFPNDLHLVAGAVELGSAEGCALLDDLEPLLGAERLADHLCDVHYLDPVGVDHWLFKKCVGPDPPQMTYLRATQNLLSLTGRLRRGEDYFVPPGPEWLPARRRLQDRLGVSATNEDAWAHATVKVPSE